MAEIGQGQHNAGAQDADANLEGAIDGQDRHVATVGGADRPQNVAGKNRRRVAGKRRGIGGEITQERGDKGAHCAPQRKSDEKAQPILAKKGGEDHNADRSDNGSDHSERSFA